jgi:phosphoribosylformylglycinamidine synthase PurS subunit
MPLFSCEVYIRPRKDILDPQGDAVEHALRDLGFRAVSDVRIGRYIRLGVEADGEAEARARLDEMCAKLLANPVTEDYEVRVTP